MTTLLSVQSVSFSNSNGPLIEEMTFSIKKFDRVGLIGYNGSGKSTILKIISGELESSSGNVNVSKHCILAHIEQKLPEKLSSYTLLDSIKDILPENEVTSSSWRCESLLKELGFENESFDVNVKNLSGGQHTRLLLARALILNPDFLLLDEPSNHLDLPTMLWLENFLSSWKGTFILISHDSYLLDKVTTNTLVLRDKKIHSFNLSCSEARKKLLESDLSDQIRNQAESREIERIEKSSRRLAEWGRIHDNEGLARKAIEMNRRVERMKCEKTVITDGSQWKLSLKGEAIDADRLLEISKNDIKVDNNSKKLFTIDNKKISTGDRIAIIGSNGVGKSTLLKYILGEFDSGHSEKVNFHPKVTIGYYDQNLHQLKDEDTLIDAMSAFSKNGSEESKIALINAGFSYNRHNQNVQSLSGGERARLLFVGLSLAKYSLLIMDEPTNHLDLEGKEELETTFNSFEGAILLVTHDRKLIENSCNRYWLIQDKELNEWNEINYAYDFINKDEIKKFVSKEKCCDDSTEIINFDEDYLLAKLLELEANLEADLKRKSKHQKIELQKKWIVEINEIKKSLEIM